jgi:hypothetical protein
MSLNVSGLAAWSEDSKWYSSLTTRCSCIAILCVSLVSFAAITLSVASQRVFVVVYFVMTKSGNLWIHPHTPARQISGFNFRPRSL